MNSEVDYTMSEKEMLKELLAKIDILFRLKYATDRDKALEREIQLCKIGLSAFNSVNIDDLENQYKN